MTACPLCLLLVSFAMTTMPIGNDLQFDGPCPTVQVARSDGRQSHKSGAVSPYPSDSSYSMLPTPTATSSQLFTETTGTSDAHPKARSASSSSKNTHTSRAASSIQTPTFSQRWTRPSLEGPSSTTHASGVDIKDFKEGLTEQSTLQKEITSRRVGELYHWCVTVSVLLVLQLISDCLHHQFQYIPHPSEWFTIFLLICSVALGLTVHFVPSARPWAAYILAVGSLLMTCQLAWHVESHVLQFKDSIILERFSQDMSARNDTKVAKGSVNPSPSFSLYGLGFGRSGLDFLGTAAFFVLLFQHCVQSSFLCRLGVGFTAIVSVMQWIVIACCPLVFSHLYPSWLFRMVGTGLWTAHLIRSSYVWQSELARQVQFIEHLQQTVAQSCKDLKDGQSADSVLNHMLKNCMADASGCLDLVSRQQLTEKHTFLLSKASDILFRGMWWCKSREALLRLVSGQYKIEVSSVNIRQFAEDCVRGRDVALLECPHQQCELDPMVCNVILDNAVTNAIRHGCPTNPRVTMSVELSDPIYNEGPAAGRPVRSSTNSSAGVVPVSSRPMRARFLVTNRANLKKPALTSRWSTQQPKKSPPKASSRSTLSDGLGLNHISMAANACGMVAELWQHDTDIFFELSFDTMATPPGPNDAVQHLNVVFPPALNILGLDDSGIARESLRMNLEQAIPDAEVAMYGKDLDEVEQFKQDSLEKADILVLDEHVDMPGVELRGSSIVKELTAAGFQGFVCIRSGDSTLADRAWSIGSGAHWHVGKEVPIREMIRQLHVEYHAFLLKRETKEAVFHLPKVSSKVTFADRVEQLKEPFSDISSSSTSAGIGRNLLNVPHWSEAGSARMTGSESSRGAMSGSSKCMSYHSTYGALSNEAPHVTEILESLDGGSSQPVLPTL